MSLEVGPAFTIPGYTTLTPPDFDTEHEAVVHAADTLPAYPAFWRFYLQAEEAERAFDTNGYDEMHEVLNDTERWPVITLTLDDDSLLRIVFRNFEEDEGIDYLRVTANKPAQVVAATDGRMEAMSWAELLAAAEPRDDRLTWAQRFLLLLPLLDAPRLPDDADDTINRALEAVGAGNRPALIAELREAFEG